MKLTTFSRSIVIAAPVAKVFAFCNSASGFRQHFPFRVVWEEGPEHWQQGTEIAFRFRYWGLWQSHRAQIVAWERDRLFVDEARGGPFRVFRHTHSFAAQEAGTLYTDTVNFSLGHGCCIDQVIGLTMLKSLFAKRHARLKAVLEKP